MQSLQEHIAREEANAKEQARRTEVLIATLQRALGAAKCKGCCFDANELDRCNTAHLPPNPKARGPHLNYCCHLAGSGMPNVIKEVKYVQSLTKFDRLHYKFLSKKRAFLARQVKLSRTLQDFEQQTAGLQRTRPAALDTESSDEDSDSGLETSIDLDLSSRTSKGKTSGSRESAGAKKGLVESITHSVSGSEQQLEGGSRDKDSATRAQLAPIEYTFSAEEVGFSQKVIDRIYGNDQAQKHFQKLQARCNHDIEAGVIDETQARFLFLDKLKEFIRKQILKKHDTCKADAHCQQVVEQEDDGDEDWEDKRRVDGKIEAAFLRQQTAAVQPLPRGSKSKKQNQVDWAIMKNEIESNVLVLVEHQRATMHKKGVKL